MWPTGVRRGRRAHTPGEVCTVRRRWATIVIVVSVRIVIADDNLLVREGLEHVLRGQGGIDVVASCEDLPSLLEAVESTQPDVVLTDIRMPPSRSDEGIQAANMLRDSHPTVGVVVLSQYAEPTYALSLLDAGSEPSRLPAEGAPRTTGAATRRHRDRRGGGSVIDPKVVDVLVAGERARRQLAAVRADAARARGAGGDRPGQEQRRDRESLVLTKRAVEKHINAIFLKLDLAYPDDEQQAREGGAVLPGRGGQWSSLRAYEAIARTGTHGACTTLKVRLRVSSSGRVRPSRSTGWLKEGQLGAVGWVATLDGM